MDIFEDFKYPILGFVAIVVVVIVGVFYNAACGDRKPSVGPNAAVNIANDLAGRSMNTACNLLPWRW